MDILAIPQYRFKSVTDITIDDLKKIGITTIALDIDNTIAYDGTSNLLPGIEDWICAAKKANFNIAIISNTFPTRARRFGKKLSVPYEGLSKKPSPRKLIKISNKFNVPFCEIAMIGDQLFADVKAANICGAISIRVDPVGVETRYTSHFKKLREREIEIIAEFEKTKGFGV